MGREESSGLLVRSACLPPAAASLALSSICQALTIAAFMSKQFFNELVPNVYSVLGTLCALKPLYNYCLWWNGQALSGFYVSDCTCFASSPFSFK